MCAINTVYFPSINDETIFSNKYQNQPNRVNNEYIYTQKRKPPQNSLFPLISMKHYINALIHPSSAVYSPSTTISIIFPQIGEYVAHQPQSQPSFLKPLKQPNKPQTQPRTAELKNI